ncbi:MAG TPA: hypothetical protein PLD25_20980 [Chloroflexota bacterium]|nr:hypothetical protein [Chloroflexota bacterium]HUM68410.1 hypothetical protein [Chloroflexota bacterium]
MIWLAAIGIYFLVTAVIVISVCALSARMSRHEEWSEMPIVETRSEAASSRDYQADTAPST